MDVDDIEDSASDGVQVPDEDFNMKSTEYPLSVGDNVDANNVDEMPLIKQLFLSKSMI
uniref:Uncharacterized protein n=1 Tax=Peronospora matthiolae TaxID=2874970 RepID=A0AAV1TQ64_9STRA